MTTKKAVHHRGNIRRLEFDPTCHSIRLDNLADDSHDALHALEQRLLYRPGIAPFTGVLSPGDIHYRVAPVR